MLSASAGRAARPWRPVVPRRAVGSATAMRSCAAYTTASSQQPTSPPLSRRVGLASAAAALLAAACAAAEPVPPAPPVGDCPECIGEINDTLNACNLASSSCVSTLNDDEAHFLAPFEFEGTREAAVEQLIRVATGGSYEAGLIDSPFGISRSDAAAYIAGGVFNVLKGEAPPPRPQRQRKGEGEQRPFDGVLVDRHTTPAGCEYVRVVLGTGGRAAEEVEDPSSVVDAEFLFLPDDALVVVRAASRVEPSQSGGQLQLSFTEGFVVDRNVARRQMDALRKALRWQSAPVITDFDPRFNPNAPLWFERFFQPFSERNSFRPSGEAYPADTLPRLGLPGEGDSTTCLQSGGC